MSAGQSGIIAGVCALLFTLLLISGGVVWRLCRNKAKRDNYAAKRSGRRPALTRLTSRPEATDVCVRRKVHSAPNKLNTVFQQLDPKARPQISEPTLMGSTAAQALTPLTPLRPLTPSPSRAPPQVGNSAPAVGPHSAGNSGFIMAFVFQFTATKEVFYTATNVRERSGRLLFISAFYNKPRLCLPK